MKNFQVNLANSVHNHGLSPHQQEPKGPCPLANIAWLCSWRHLWPLWHLQKESWQVEAERSHPWIHHTATKPNALLPSHPQPRHDTWPIHPTGGGTWDVSLWDSGVDCTHTWGPHLQDCPPPVHPWRWDHLQTPSEGSCRMRRRLLARVETRCQHPLLCLTNGLCGWNKQGRAHHLLALWTFHHRDSCNSLCQFHSRRAIQSSAKRAINYKAIYYISSITNRRNA